MLTVNKLPYMDLINKTQLSIYAGGHAHAKTEWKGFNNFPVFSRLYYIVDGDPYIEKNGVRKNLEKGKLYLLPTGYSFKYGSQSLMEQLYLHISLNDSNGFDLLRNCDKILECAPPERFQEDFISCFSGESIDVSLRLRQITLEALLKLFSQNNVKLQITRYSKCVKLALEYIRSHPSIQLSAANLAKISFVSESTLSKKFKSEVGVTLGSYIDDIVMFKAEQLLTRSDLTVLQISETFDFCDQFYFSRRFKLKYGETPQKYRKLKLI